MMIQEFDSEEELALELACCKKMSDAFDRITTRQIPVAPEWNELQDDAYWKLITS